MCLKAPKLPPIRSVPNRNDASQSSLARDAEKRRRQASGVFGNIFTSTTGDPNYGENTSSRSTVNV